MANTNGHPPLNGAESFGGTIETHLPKYEGNGE